MVGSTSEVLGMAAVVAAVVVVAGCVERCRIYCTALNLRHFRMSHTLESNTAKGRMKELPAVQQGKEEEN